MPDHRREQSPADAQIHAQQGRADIRIDSARDCACGRVTDGKKALCCRLCPEGQHLVGCAIRQVSAGRWPAPKVVPAARLEVVR